jgi:photosystem II stability/assembly factor-like uncharacterized protein
MAPLLRILALAIVTSLAAAVAGAQPVLFHDHGHGLAFSSDGRALLAPSHDGLAIYESGQWRRVSTSIGGFSGFSVAERAIYSSGHSRPGAAAAPSAGLIRSNDGGRSWQPLALSGEVDFRLLAASYRTNVIYVLNAAGNAVMAQVGIYATHDEGRSWRRAGARGLKGEIHGLAAHPLQAGTLAVATGRGLFISRDSGDSFRRLDGREPATAVVFDFNGDRVRYARALSNEVVESTMEGRERRALRLPPLHGDYVTCLAQSPKDAGVLAFATRRRDVYLTENAGRSWRHIAEGGNPHAGSGSEEDDR